MGELATTAVIHEYVEAAVGDHRTVVVGSFRILLCTTVRVRKGILPLNALRIQVSKFLLGRIDACCTMPKCHFLIPINHGVICRAHKLCDQLKINFTIFCHKMWWSS